MMRIAAFIFPFSGSWWLPSTLLAFHLLLLTVAIQFWQYHHEYERELPGYERIYRLSASFDTEQGRRYLAAAPPGTNEWLSFFFEDALEGCTYLLPTEGAILSHKGKYRFSKYVFLSDSSFFRVFQLPVDKHFEANQAVAWLSDSVARALETEKPADSLEVRSASALFFDGVYQYEGRLPLSSQTHLQIDALLLGAPLTRRQQLSWRYVYVKMPASLTSEAEQYWEKRITDSLSVHYNEYKALHFELTAIDRLHLKTWDMPEEELAMGDSLPRVLPQAVLAVASFLFVVTAFYYALWLRMRWMMHRKEWFVRWVSGEMPVLLYGRYLLYVFTAWGGVVLLAGVLHEWLPYERWFMLPRMASFMKESPFELWMACAGACMFSFWIGARQRVRFLSVYRQPQRPAFSLRPARILWLPLWGQLLLFLSAGGILGLMLQQLAYVERHPLGYDTRALVLVRLPQYGVQAGQLQEAQKALLELPFVRSVGRVLEVPSDLLLPQLIVYKQGQKPGVWQSLLWGRMMVMENAPDALGVTLLRGRYFKPEDDVRTTLMVNEEGYKQLNGAALAFVTDSTGKPLPARIIGVVRNFHFESLHRPVVPMVWLKGDGRIGSILIRLKEEVSEKHLQAIHRLLGQTLPAVPFIEEKQYDLVRQQYNYERVLVRLLALAWAAMIPGFLLTAWIGIRQWIGLRQRSAALYRLLGASVYDFLRQELKIPFVLACLALLLVIWVQYEVETRWIQEYFAYFSPVWYYSMWVPAGLFVCSIAMLYVFALFFWKRIYLPEQFRV
ncbi:ADOP family protein [Thermonema rossianum]|uniref:hypothetical protein n=1 Tax=Thermonema rossianum TaxID=55505 RepID=UPI00056DDAA5|nr:hypothetical protein [Thermonema rossianum]